MSPQPESPDVTNGYWRRQYEEEFRKRTADQLTDHEERLRSLEKDRWKLLGIAIGAGTIVEFVSRLFFK